MVSQEIIDKAAQLILKKRRVVALTGAGISADSGISTYRDRGGLWDRYPEGSSGGIMAVLANHPEDSREILTGVFDSIKAARPNQGHRALVDLEKMGYLRSVITQNVDNLHREAGNSCVMEMHGNIYRLRCLKCGRKEILERQQYFEMVAESFKKMDRVSLEDLLPGLPPCSCGGKTRLDFVAFGEPVQELAEAQAETMACDLMLILGTSGVVYPAAALPAQAKSHGAILIEINPEKSALTGQCDLFIDGKTDDILPRIVSSLKGIGG